MHLDFHGLSLRGPSASHENLHHIILLFPNILLYHVVIHVASLLLVDSEVVAKLLLLSIFTMNNLYISHFAHMHVYNKFLAVELWNQKIYTWLT